MFGCILCSVNLTLLHLPMNAKISSEQISLNLARYLSLSSKLYLEIMRPVNNASNFPVNIDAGLIRSFDVTPTSVLASLNNYGLICIFTTACLTTSSKVYEKCPLGILVHSLCKSP